MCCALDLVVVVVQTGDVGTSEFGNFTSRATNATADIKDLHATLDVDAVGEVVLMSSDGLIERFAVGEAAKVEGLSPAVLVQIRRKVVVTIKGQMVSYRSVKPMRRGADTYCLVRVAYSA